MTLDELHSKWYVKHCEVNYSLKDAHGNSNLIKMEDKQHMAPLGDFIKAYYEHLSISWWRKDWDWKIVDRLMRDALNQMHVQFYGN